MKNKKLLIALILILAVGAIGVAAGVSVAYWTEASALTGFAPQAYTYDYTVWVKYVEWEFNTAKDSWTNEDGVYVWSGEGTPDYSVAITGFKDFLGEDVVFPKELTVSVKLGAAATAENKTLTVTKIRNTVFADVSLKAMPTSIVIPPGVEAEASAFSGLTNLKDVVFGGTNVTSQTSVGAYAFAGCSALRSVTFESGRNGGGNSIAATVRFYENAFLGCDALSSVSDIGNVSSITYSASATDAKGNWSGFKSYVGINNAGLSLRRE